ncbi:MAG: hypothetical protein QW279_16185 [Candidatus Jordarchaeaceae archaeon]
MPRRSTDTVGMLTLIAFIVFILSFLLIFIAWTQLQSNILLDFMIGYFAGPLVGILLLFITFNSSTMMMGILAGGLGIIILLIAVILGRS